MLQVARLAPKALRESSDLVRDFILGQLNPDGGFRKRDGASDLYYSVFGMECLLALRADFPAARFHKFLDTYGDGDGLDFVHLCCLARCRANAGITEWPEELRAALAARIESHRTPDGGYHQEKGRASGSVYAAFLAFGAYEDLQIEIPVRDTIPSFLATLRTPDGAWANDAAIPIGSTPATAAAVTLLRVLNEPIPGEVADWLLARHHPKGGFLAMPRAPIPDLLSTAVALHALAGMQASLDSVREPCFDFIDSLWTNKGAFHGNWTDEHLDCEYTYYGLLALGHLSV